MKLASSRVTLGLILLWSVDARCQVDTARTAPIAPLTRVPSSAWGADVMVIDSAEIAQSAAQTFSELLQARRPGVRVFQQGWNVSDGSLVMLRGPTSLSGSTEPVLIVDGVRVDSRQSDSVEVGPSRLDDLAPEDIQRIEILSGAAAALYGDGAANGVILVTTKSGAPGPLRISGRATWDARQVRDVFPANYERVGVSPTTGQPVADCSLVAVANSKCTPTGLDVWNPLEQASPFHVGNSGRGHIDLRGSSLGTELALGVTGDAVRGNLPHDETSRLGVRGKVSRVLPWGLGFSASASWLRNDARFAPGIVASGLSGTAQDDVNHGYQPLPSNSDTIAPRQRLRHATGGIQLRWQPARWLEAAVVTGRDRVTGHLREDQFGTPTPGNFFSYEEHSLTTSAAHVSASYDVRPNIAANTAIGYERDVLHANTTDSLIFSAPLISHTSFRMRSTAFWVSERLMLSHHVAISAADERITSNLFGNGAGKEWFPSANLSWTPTARTGFLSNVRLRAAFADAANPTASLVGFAYVLVTNLQPVPPPPKMERTTHMEAGADATLGSAVTVDLTAFDSRSSHLWVLGGPQYPVAPVQGAEMTNKGVEARVAAPLLDRSRFRWTGSLSLAIMHNDVSHLTAAPRFLPGNIVIQGKPYGGLWGTTYTYADANHDGIIDTSEVHLGRFAYIGAPLPTLESAASTDFTLPGGVVLSGTLDYRGGYHVLNFTEALRCSTLRTCRGAQDPGAPLAEQAAAVSARLNGTSAAAWLPGASFMKVREIAVRWTIPTSVARILGTTGDLAVAGRNLATWTNYPGLDPEISSGPAGALPREDAFGLPIPREFIIRLDLATR